MAGQGAPTVGQHVPMALQWWAGVLGGNGVALMVCWVADRVRGRQ